MKRRRLGQHYLVDQQVVRRVVDLAQISPAERVLEIGTGRGELTRELAGRGRSFVGYEVDRENFDATSELVRDTGAQVRFGDAFKERPEFDVLVASLPYSESGRFVRWLSVAEFDRAVVVLQEDFVRKLLSPPGSRDYRGVSALAQVAFEVTVLGNVDRRSFSPQPRVNSVVALLVPRRRISEEEVSRVIRLFSLRRRRVDTALTELGVEGRRTFGERRVNTLTPDEVHELCARP